MKYKWEDIQEAINSKNRLQLKKIGLSYGKPKLEQEGVPAHEVAQQLIALAPGDHPHIGPLLLDLADKLKASAEWH